MSQQLSVAGHYAGDLSIVNNKTLAILGRASEHDEYPETGILRQHVGHISENRIEGGLGWAAGVDTEPDQEIS